MKKKTNPPWDYFKLLIFVVCLIELVLFLIAMIFGRLFGYQLTIIACFWLGVIVAACFAVIVFANLTIIGFNKLRLKIKKTA